MIRVNILVLLLLEFNLFQCAPMPRIPNWNPYHYPTVRVLSLPPQPLQHSRTTPSTLMRFVTDVNHIKSRRDIDRRAIDRNLNFSSNSSQSTGNLTEILKNFNLGKPTALKAALLEFIKSTEEIVRELLITSQNNLLNIIGEVDLGADRFQKDLQNSIFQLFLNSQMASSEVYHALPPFLNRLLKRLTSPMDARSREQFTVQFNEAIANLRRLKKMLRDAIAEHEVDFHNVFQDKFKEINGYLRTPGLPKRAFGWFKS